MNSTILLSVINAKYVHASPAPWCLAAGVKAYAPELYDRLLIRDFNGKQKQEDMLRMILSEKPGILSFSCYLWNIKATLELCREVKKASPETLIILGGPEVSYCADKILLENLCVDYVFSGEGEEGFPAFLQATVQAEGLLDPEAGRAIPGLWGRQGEGIYENSPAILSGGVPSPLTAGYQEAVKGRMAYFETSRGCPYSCAFCLSGRCGMPRYFDLEAIRKNASVLNLRKQNEAKRRQLQEQRRQERNA